MVDVDVTALAALFVSLVALVVAFTQVVQQYAATGYDYRRCSAQTMGGWADRTRRKFIWREVRFQVTFSTPIITIDDHDPPLTSELFQIDSLHNIGDHVNISVDAEPLAEHRPTSARYSLKRALKDVSRVSSDSREPKWHSIEEEPKPWFLSAEGTRDEAKCLWLDFLEDIAYTNLRFTLEEQRSSYDFVPDGLQRPVAAVDIGCFLTIMSLFGIQWNNRGIDGKFTGISESGFGEISLTNIFNFGDVYQYRRRTSRLGRSEGQSNAELKRTRFIVPSEQAKLAMFNRFELGFTTIRTYDSLELGDSLRKLHMSEEMVRKFTGFFDRANGWVPGVRDAVACWAPASMPKMVTLPQPNTVTSATESYEVEFKSVFSARFAVPFSSEPGIAAMLLGGDHNDSHWKSRYDRVQSIRHLTDWAKEYLASLPVGLVQVIKECLSWIASRSPTRGNVMLDDVHVPYSLSVKCLEGTLALDRALDQYLDAELPSYHQERARQIKSKFCLEQIQCQCNTDDDFTVVSREEHTSWMMVADTMASGYYCALPSKIAEMFDVIDKPSAQIRAQRMVVNRLMRASLWAVHNGNAPNPLERSLQCSLSSRWLQQPFTIYLS